MICRSIRNIVLPASIMILLISGCTHNDVDGGRTEKTDPGAPRTIQLEVITCFQCDFYTEYISDYTGSYEHCGMTMDSTEAAWSGTKNGASFEVKADINERDLSSLQKIITDSRILADHGFTGYTAGIPDNCGGTMDASFESGEYIHISDNAEVRFASAVEPLINLFLRCRKY